MIDETSLELVGFLIGCSAAALFVLVVFDVLGNFFNDIENPDDGPPAY